MKLTGISKVFLKEIHTLRIAFFSITLLIGPFVVGQQDSTIKEIEYPFGPPGTEVSRGVFGRDDRKEASEAIGYDTLVRATAVMINKRFIRGNRIYGYTLRERLERQFNTKRFHSNVKFLDQPAIAQCTGFLIGPDLLVTAGHCIENSLQAGDFVWVFDYTNSLSYNENRKFIEVPQNNIYTTKELLISELEDADTGIDYAVLRLDRKSDRSPYKFRTSGKILPDTPVYTIGTPTGLPLKFVDNATVTSDKPKYWFRSDMDVFPGNSGGPVFDTYGFIEGIMVRTSFRVSDGDETGDYYFDDGCRCVRTVRWPARGLSVGSSAHRITAMPPEIILSALYENVAYAIETQSINRLKSWMIYKWILTLPYTRSRGGFELLALENRNDGALETILPITVEEIDDSYAGQLLHKAVALDHTSGLKILLDNDLIPDAGADQEHTPLYSAVALNRPQAAELLLAYGANAQVQSQYGGNLLHLAATTGSFAMADLLIANGVSLNKKNNIRRRPEKVARKYGYKSLGKYLKRARKRR